MTLIEHLEQLNKNHKTNAEIRIKIYPMICLPSKGVSNEFLAVYKDGDFIKIGLIKRDGMLHTFNRFEDSQNAKKMFGCTDQFQADAAQILDAID